MFTDAGKFIGGDAAAQDVLRITLHIGIRHDAGQPARQQGGFFMFLQQALHPCRTAYFQTGNRIDLLIYFLQGIELRQQRCCRLCADTGNTRYIIDAVARQGQPVGYLPGMYAEPVVNCLIPMFTVAREVPQHIAFFKQLRQVLVGTQYDNRKTLLTQALRKRSDQVVGLVVLAGKIRQPSVRTSERQKPNCNRSSSGGDSRLAL